MNISSESREGSKPVTIPDELIDTVAAAIRYAYAIAVQPRSFPPDLDLVGSVEEWRGEAEAAINAVFDSDVFARIVREQAVLNNPQITAEVAAYHANPSDVEEEIMPIEYRVLVEDEVVFTSGHQAIAEGYAHGLKLRGEKGRLEVVAVGNNS